MRITPIDSALPGEHLAATSPVMRPETDDARWRLRLHFWAGRALTADALQLEQEHRAGRLAWRGRLATPGIAHGLEVALESPDTPPDDLTLAGHFIHVLPGHGFLADGEDIVVPRPLRVPLDQVPVHYVRFDIPNDELPPEAAPAGATPGAPRSAGGFVINVDEFPAGHIAWAAALLLAPAEFRAFEGVDPEDPCELDASRDAFADERRVDACVLRLCQLPVRLESLPELADRDDPRWRNRLARAVLTDETLGSGRQQILVRPGEPRARRWETVLRPARLSPWDILGVPLALLSSEIVEGTTARAFFLDRASVVRPGGHARQRTRPALRLATDESDAARNPLGAGTPITWRAAVDQAAEQMGQFPARNEAEVGAMAARFQFLPPAGFLPRAALSFLTTADALALPPRDDQVLDRAGINHFFPASFAVEAVPVAIEDLDSALAASAPLAPYDLTADTDIVRVLVPMPQRVFDPQVLVVEQEDPVFAATIARFVAVRQDWRQRRDFARDRREALQELATGPVPDVTRPTLEPGQLEPEPVETVDTVVSASAFVSPLPATELREAHVAFESRELTAGATPFVALRVDRESMPGRIELFWRRGAEVVSSGVAQPLEAAAEPVDADGAPRATALWQPFTVVGGDAVTGAIDNFTVRLSDGRIGLAAAGQIASTAGADEEAIETFWRAEDAGAAPQFIGGDWTAVTAERLLAPFEDVFEPVFADGSTITERLDDLDTQLRLTETQRVRETGLEALIRRVAADLNRCDDAVDLDFLKAQSNIHRIRQVMLGEQVANELLTSPALSSVVSQKSARVAQEDLISTLNALPSAPAPPIARDTLALASGVGATSFVNLAGAFVPATTFTPGTAVTPITEAEVVLQPRIEAIAAVAEPRGFRLDRREAVLEPLAPVRDDVLAAEPAVGKGFELRTLTIAKRFDSGPTRAAYDYAEAELRTTIGRIVRLPLEFDDDDPIPEVTDDAATPQPVSFGRLAREGNALLVRLRLPTVSASDDSPAIFAQGVRRADATVLILRRLEFYIARKREQLARAREALAAVQSQIAVAAARILAIEGKLNEARHDVAVARALRQEEQQRIARINDRRDALIRNSVRFLAYVRPRTVDTVRRNVPYWQVEPFGVAAPVPACLKRHDEPPPALNAYVQLFRHSPARWFSALVPLLAKLDTPDKVIALLDASRASALSFAALGTAAEVRGSAQAVQFTVLAAHQAIGALRQRSAQIAVADARTRRWTDIQRDAEAHAAVGDLIGGRHGSSHVSAAAAAELEQIGRVATCLHAEFAAVPAATRLAWIERFSQFDRPALLRDLTVLPGYGRLERDTRRRLQEFADWLFGRVNAAERDAVILINDLIRLCLLLASHAPVNRIIAGHVPRPTLVRPGIQIPIRPLNPELVRVGMEFHVWQASKVVARGRVEDLKQGEVSARVDHVEAQTTTIDTTMRVQFVPAALSLIR
jgi:hypothetical protein